MFTMNEKHKEYKWKHTPNPQPATPNPQPPTPNPYKYIYARGGDR